MPNARPLPPTCNSLRRRRLSTKGPSAKPLAPMPSDSCRLRDCPRSPECPAKQRVAVSERGGVIGYAGDRPAEHPDHEHVQWRRRSVGSFDDQVDHVVREGLQECRFPVVTLPLGVRHVDFVLQTPAGVRQLGGYHFVLGMSRSEQGLGWRPGEDGQRQRRLVLRRISAEGGRAAKFSTA